MKKLISTIVCLLISLSVAAQQTSGTANGKTLSVSTHMGNLLLNGINIETEYHGFGALGIFGGGYWNTYNTGTPDYQTNGLSFVGGAKYYLEYNKRGLDSIFVGTELQYVDMEMKDKEKDVYEWNTVGLIGLFGKRWMLDPVFFETAIGVGVMRYNGVSMDDEFSEYKDSLIKDINELKGKWGITFDLKLMAGVAF